MTCETPNRHCESADREVHIDAAYAPWQFSLRSLLIATAIASVCLAIGVHLAGVMFTLAVIVLLQAATMLMADWLIRPQNRYALAFVTTGSWILLGSVFVILGGRMSYGAIGAAHQTMLWSTGMCIVGVGFFCYYLASRRWRRLRCSTRENCSQTTIKSAEPFLADSSAAAEPCPLMSDANRQIERLTTLAEQDKEDDLRNTTVEERWNMVRQLTIEEWAKKGIDITKLPMRKDIERLTRLKDK